MTDDRNTPRRLRIRDFRKTWEAQPPEVREEAQRLLAEHLAVRRCSRCYDYEGGFATQAFTKWTCKGCGVKNLHHDGTVPFFCGQCAENHGACPLCGMEMD